MEGKILLYDSNDVKIGETFVRRAKQLVKQQRASWVDDEQKAIKFAPGMENLDVDNDVEGEQISTPDKSSHGEDWLINLAEKRLKERKLFKVHSIVFVPVTLIIFLLFAMVVHNGFTYYNEALVILGFALGSSVTAYGIHAYFYRKSIPAKSNPTRNERHAKKLAVEIAMIKTELSA